MSPRYIYLIALIIVTIISGLWFVVPRLNPMTQDGLPRLVDSLSSVTTVPQRQRVLGYERNQFGNGWARVSNSACTSRELSIIRQTTESIPSRFDACSVQHGVLHDPYSQKNLDISSPDVALEVDHVFPLSAAWDLGAYTWDTQTRIDFANDPLNLVVTAKEHNQDKSDQLPSQWMPPHRGSHCWYGTRLAAVAAKYDLRLPTGDTRRIVNACRFAFIQKYD